MKDLAQLGCFLGFDFGTKRIGVAIGQTVTLTARPLMTLKAVNGEPNWLEVKKIVEKWRVDALVVGIPLNMDGSEQLLTQKAAAFAKALEVQTALPVFTMDERLTTKAAREKLFAEGGFKSVMGGQVDEVAAQLILENWFAENINKK